MGGKLEGMINLPIAARIAFRAVAFYEHDAGFIDNVFGARTYCGDTIYDRERDDASQSGASTTAQPSPMPVWKEEFQRPATCRAAGRRSRSTSTTIGPSRRPSCTKRLKTNGVFFYDPNIGDLKIDRFRKETSKDRFWQAALTVQGKIANFDVTYAGAYMDRPNFGINDYTDYTDAYDQLYDESLRRALALFCTSTIDAGNPIDPQQYIIGTNHFKKLSQELRFASPADKPFRVIAGAFYQRQTNFIHQDYRVDDLARELSVNGLPGTLWLTQQKRIDKDYALFGEASFDVTPQITLTGGRPLLQIRQHLIRLLRLRPKPARSSRARDDNAFRQTQPAAARPASPASRQAATRLAIAA